jgi:hypothetical protein
MRATRKDERLTVEIDGLQCDVDDGMVDVELDLDDETIKLLEQTAADRGVTVDQLVNEALEAALDKVEQNLEVELEDIDAGTSGS